MAEIIKQIQVDVAKKNTFQAIVAKQGDASSRFLKVQLTNESVPISVSNGSVVTINVKRSDDASNAFLGTVNQDGTVTVPLSSWMLAIDGAMTCSISVVDSEERKLTTTAFTVNVEFAEYTGDEVAEDENYDILVQLLADVAETTQGVQEVVDAAVTATNNANTATDAANAAVASYNASSERIENAVESIETANVTATEDADRAVVARTAAENAAGRAEAAEDNVDEQAETLNAQIALKGDNLFFNEEDGKLYLTSEGEIIGDGVVVATGGGGGGGSSNNATINLTNTTGWLSKTLAVDSACVLTGTWSSIEDGSATGNGVLTVKVGGVVKDMRNIAQGSFSVDVASYLTSGTNTVKVSVADVYGNSRTINFTISVVSLSLTSTFDASIPYSGNITYVYIPFGSVSKTVHFKLDGTEIGTSVVSVSGRQQSYSIPTQNHGAHSFEVYFTAEIDGQTVESNRLYYSLICTESGNTTPIVACAFNKTTAAQYETLIIPYIVYNPASLSTAVILGANGSPVSSLTIDRTEHNWEYRADDAGALSLTITCGSTVKTIALTISETTIDATAVTEDSELYLSSYGRSNDEANPASWIDGLVACSFAGYNWQSDGWQTDNDGLTVHRVSGDARLTIPLQIFANDFRTTGKTIEIEFATRNVLDYDSVILSCFTGNRGLRITAQRAILKSGQSEVSTQYKEDEHIRLTFVVEKRVENRLIYVYINGIMCGATQYPADDDFSQTSPVNITIGSNDCTIDLYTIRVYNNNLTRHQVLENWIADTQDITEKLARYNRNNVYDDYGSIIIDNLPSNLPYMVLEAPALPVYKGNKLSVDGYYVDPENSENSFDFADAQADVQGTSSAGYARKNYKIKFRNGFIKDGITENNYQLRSTSIPTNTFTFKADVASSEGANNVELVRLFNSICPYKTSPQLLNANIRQGIDGFPMVIFHDNGSGAVFVGKYNFNNDKGTPEVYGFADGDESWEILNNTSNRVLFKSADFTGDGWKSDFEARYPEDNVDTAKLAAFIAFVASTDRTAATDEALSEAVTYDGTTYTTDSSAYRLAKFKAEFEDYAVLDSAIFYYLFTELFLMVDSRAKNAFPSAFGSDKICWLPYDMDTAIGINNEGSLVFGYELEDTDTTSGGADIYNGQQSVLWQNLRDAFSDEIKAMYQELRSDNAISYDIVEQAFETHQAKWSEAIWNEDAWYKYLQPLVEDNTASYLGMLQGSKSEQRKWWLYNRFRYIDSKYNAGDALSDFITLRGYAVGNISVIPYADIYTTVKYGSYLVRARALRGNTYTLACPLDNLNDTEIYIYSASQLKSIGNLSALKVGYADFSMATKLTSLELGSSDSEYSNGNLTELYLGNNTLLQTLDVRNCPNLGTGTGHQTVDISGCTNIENVYFDGTAITGLVLPNGGILKVLHLPETITNLTVCNQTALTDFTLAGASNITTLRLENVSALIDGLGILQGMAANGRVRLIGVSWTFENVAAAIAVYDKLDTMRGLDENGNNTEVAQVSGTIHIPSLTGAQLTSLQNRYPDISITYDHISSTVNFYNGSTLLTSVTVLDGGDATYPGATPTKSSTAQYTYAFNGWSLTDGGTVNANALKAVSADRNVYAAYTSTLRTYTVRFYNGTTLLQTQTVAYGSNATYTGSTPVSTDDPAEEFTGWNPSPINITGARDCYAVFQSNSALDNATWAEISTISAAGTGANYFSVGDCKAVALDGTVGTVELNQTLYVYILGFNHNSAVEGNGISFGCFKTALKSGINVGLVDSGYGSNFTDGSKKFNMNHSANTNVGGWKDCDLRYDILGSVDANNAQNASTTTATNPVADTLMAALPAALRAVMKPITKYTDNTGNANNNNAAAVTTTIDYLPLLSEFEVFGTRSYANTNEQTYQAQYAYYSAGNSKVKYRHSATGSTAFWWERSACYDTAYRFCIVGTGGSAGHAGAAGSRAVAPAFLV